MQSQNRKPSKAKKLSIPQSEQSARFIETARALGADEDEAAFKEKLAVIARQKVKPKPKNSTDE